MRIEHRLHRFSQIKILKICANLCSKKLYWSFYLLLSALAWPFAYPLLWMVATAFKRAGQIYTQPLQLWPQPWTLENFPKAWQLLDFPQFMRNSLWITGWTLVGTLLSSALVGYAFAILPGRGKQLLFGLLLATTMLPSAVTLIPLFVLFSKLGWVNTWLPLIVPACFGNPFYIFMLRQFFLTLPRELFDAAEIDGCHPLRAFWQVALPLATPALAAVAIFSFINSWNDFLTPLIYLNLTRKFTLSLGLSMFYGLFYTQLQYLMPMALLALLPVLILYLLAQRYFVEGIRGFTYVS